MYDDDEFPVELVSGIPVVTTPDEIDIANSAELRRALLGAAAHWPGTLVADMTRTRFCDSSGLHVLVAAHKRALSEGGALLLVISSAAVLRILSLTGVDRAVPNFASLDEAMAHAAADNPVA